MALREIFRLGNPALRVRCERVRTFGTEELQHLADDLRDTLEDVRARLGFGRGIAAPQIGVMQRVVFIHVDIPQVLVNPVIRKRSRRMMMLWDDCLSFPDLLAKVRRNLSVTVAFQGLDGRRHSVHAEGGLAELLQHEIDHLDGILAIDRALDSRHIVYRGEYEKWHKGSEKPTM